MKILLAIEDSPASQLATRQLAEKPWPEGTVVEVLTVVEQTPMWAMSETLEAVYHHAKEMIDRATATLHAAGLITHGFVASGDPKKLILERAKESKPDLIIVGSHRVAPLADLFLGNVASHTLRHSECSVAIIRPRLDGEDEARRILLATDGSADAEAAARFIAARPWPEGTIVRVLSVVEVILPTMHALFEPPFVHSDEVHKLREQALLRAQNAVAKAASIITAAGLEVSESVSILLDGTKDVILKDAKQWGADRIVVGGHGHSAMERLVMGSVSEAIASQAHCSVEVVRSPREA